MDEGGEKKKKKKLMRVRRSPPGEEKKPFSMGPTAEEDNEMPEAAAEHEINDLRRLLA